MRFNNPKNLIKILRENLVASIDCEGDLEKCLRAARAYCKALYEFDCGKLADPELEEKLLLLFRSIDLTRNYSKTLDDLHVASEVYDYGGHTKLLEALVEEGAKQHRNQAVLLTRGMTERHQQAMAQIGAPVSLAPSGETARALAIYRAGRAANCVTLHIHPDDVGAAIAARALREDGVRVLFVNHADHSFSVGTEAADAILEISGTGWELTRRYRPHNAQSFLGIPIRPLFTMRTSCREPIVVSVGSWWKYRPTEAPTSFQDIAAKVLNRCSAHLEIVGTDGSERWWDRLKTEFGDRIKFHGKTDFGAMGRVLSKATCYLDSIPTTGGTIFSEASMSGLPVFGLSNEAGGYTVLDEIRFTDPMEMVKEIVDCCNGAENNPIQKAARDELSEISNLEAVAKRFTAAKNGHYSVLPKKLEHIRAVPTARPGDKYQGNRIQLLREILKPDLFRILDRYTRRRVVFDIWFAGGPFSAFKSKLRFIKKIHRAL